MNNEDRLRDDVRGAMLREMYAIQSQPAEGSKADMYRQTGKAIAESQLQKAKPLVEKDEQYAEKKYIQFLEQKILDLQNEHRILKSNQRTLEIRVARLYEKTKRNSE